MKGIIFTSDALLAILISTILLIATAQALASQPTSNLAPLGLQRLQADALAGMDKEGVLATALADGDTAEIRSFLGIMPANLCLTTTVRNQAGTLMLADQPACQCTGAKTTAQRAFLRITSTGVLEPYIASMEGCFT